jgi:phosphocarrier protein
MIEKELHIINKLGLHARAAAKFVTCAGNYQSDVKLARNGRTVNGKSIMGVMMLAAAKGTSLALTVDGPDEEQAVQSIEELVNAKFGEGE